MKNSKIAIWALLNSLAVFLYTSGVVWLMNNAQKFFGMANTFWIPLSVLLLFVVSATIVGLLILGRPGYLYFSGMKTEGLKMLFYTIGCLVIITIVVFICLSVWS